MSKTVYRFINSVVLLLAAYCEFLALRNMSVNMPNSLNILALVALVLCVHSIKMLRLYVLLYGTTLSFKAHLDQFCKTSVVSLLLPWKLGDLFRAYCYAFQMKNAFQGVFMILVDRFMDTAGLVFLLTVLVGLGKMNVTVLLLFWLMFLFLCTLVYALFPAFYRFWNNLLIERYPATGSKNHMLFALERIQALQNEFRMLLQGRSALLFMLSLLAWTTEIGGIALLKLLWTGGPTFSIAHYLGSALGLGSSAYQSFFVQGSVFALLFLYLLLTILFLVKWAEDRT